MKKLTYEEAYQYALDGLALKKSCPSLRTGQAIMLSLPEDIYKSLAGTPNDFFQSNCLEDVLSVLYSDVICGGH